MGACASSLAMYKGKKHVHLGASCDTDIQFLNEETFPSYPLALMETGSDILFFWVRMNDIKEAVGEGGR